MKRALICPQWVLRALALGSVVFATNGCTKDGAPIGPPDSYVIYEPAGAADPAGGALPAFREVKLEDARAVPIHRSTMDGFLGELLRTDYLVKQLIRDGWRGKTFAALARARAGEPTVLVLAGARMARPDEAKLGIGFS